MVRIVGFPHSEIHGYNVCRRLPVAYRSLPRPSSALGAKASTLCPYDLILGIALLSIQRLISLPKPTAD
jgi:hypothetical protein